MAATVSTPPSPTVASSHCRRDGLSVTTNDLPWQAVWFMLISLVNGMVSIVGLADSSTDANDQILVNTNQYPCQHSIEKENEKKTMACGSVDQVLMICLIGYCRHGSVWQPNWQNR